MEKTLLRDGKITLKKRGFFATVWKRGNDGKTHPYDSSDPYDKLIISVESSQRLGKFIFPKNILIKHGIFSNKGNGGKRGFRLYPPWEKDLNKQATKTQEWQVEFFN